MALADILSALGVAVPADHDGACLRCGKPRSLRGDEEGLCIDCHDECSYFGDDGFEETARAELRAGRWFIQCGANHWKNSLVPEIQEHLPPDERAARPVSVWEALHPPQGRSEAG